MYTRYVKVIKVNDMYQVLVLKKYPESKHFLRYTYCEYTRKDIAEKHACNLADELQAILIA
jgi:hypothetical protein